MNGHPSRRVVSKLAAGSIHVDMFLVQDRLSLEPSSRVRAAHELFRMFF